MNIILSFLLSIITCCIGIKEMKKYESISDKLQKFIFLYPILLIAVFYFAGNKSFSLFFGAITPILISHFIIDIKEQELPDISNLVIAIFALLRLLYIFIKSGFDITILPVLTNCILTGIILFVIYIVLTVVTGGALGGGDIKLIGAIGMFFPTSMLVKLLAYPVFLGALIAICLLISKKGDKDTKFAFGPAIILATYLIAII